MSNRSSDLAINGGPPVRTQEWPTVDHGFGDIGDSELAAVQETLKSRRLNRYDGRPVAETQAGRFEKALCESFGAPFAIATSGGTASLALGLLGAGVTRGDLVACSGFTFEATPSAIVLAGAEPVLMGATENLHFDVDDLRAKYTPEMRAVVVVHMRGMASAMPAIMQFAEEKNLMVIEDCCGACGVKIDGQRLGTFGHAGAFSTQSHKSMNTGEGGFVLFNTEETYARALVYSGAYTGHFYAHFPKGKAPKNISPLDYPLFNFRMSEMVAALGRVQLERMGAHLEQQHQAWRNVAEALRDVPGIQVREPLGAGALLGESLLLLHAEASAEKTAWLAAALRAEGIPARAFADPSDPNARAFWNWKFLFPGETPEAIREKLPKTAARISQAIDIPVPMGLDAQAQKDLVRALNKVRAGCG